MIGVLWKLIPGLTSSTHTFFSGWWGPAMGSNYCWLPADSLIPEWVRAGLILGHSLGKLYPRTHLKPLTNCWLLSGKNRLFPLFPMHVGEWDRHDVSTVRSCFNFNRPDCMLGRRGAWSEYRLLLLSADLEEAGGWDLHQLDRHHISLTVKCKIHVPVYRSLRVEWCIPLRHWWLAQGDICQL